MTISDDHTHRNQRIRLQRLSMASASYALQATIALMIAWLGAITWTTAAVYVLGLAAIVTGFHVVFLSGFNLRFAEPNLTFVQVLTPLVPAFYLLVHIDDLSARAGLVLTVVVPLLYGTLDLSFKRFLLATLAYFVCYAGVFAVNVAPHPLAPGTKTEWLILMTLALLLVQIGLIGGFIGRLRNALHRKNRELGHAMAQIADLAVRDELTGIYNRRRLMDVLESEAARSARSGAIFSLCLFDLDQFKQVNDKRGHLVGDRVLVAVANTVADTVRDIDTFGRFGGEEFLLIMPLTELTGAVAMAERLRREIHALSLIDDTDTAFRITVSIGVTACVPDTSFDTTAALRRADNALYRAKSHGRDRVVAADTHDPLRHQGTTRTGPRL